MLRRFMSKVECSHAGCDVWTGSRRKDGYGRFRIDGKTQLAHRVSFEIWKGPIPNGMDVCHRCDNPSCVNPVHLFLATHVGNMQDKIKKRRDHNQQKTHCPQGHEYTPANAYTAPGTNSRACRTCRCIRKNHG